MKRIILNINMIGFVSLFWAASVKDDIASFEDSLWWSGIELHPFIVFIKSNSNIFAMMFLLSIFSSVWWIKSIRMRRFRLAALFAILLVYSSARSSFVDQEIALKVTFLVLLLLLVQIVISSAVDIVGVEGARAWLYDSILYFFIIFVSINLLQVMFGYGFVPGNPRLFGTSAHPNFIGVQSSIAAMVLFSAAYANKGVRRLILGILFFTAIGLIILSGSRTGIVLFFVSISSYFFVVNRFRFTGIFPLIISIGLVLLAILYGSDIFGDSFVRGDLNTRAHAFASLWAAVQESPVIGEGKFPRYSENSYLRGWATFGILYPTILVVVSAGSLISYARLSLLSRAEEAPRLMFGIMCGLSVGGLLEGYLTDTFSLPILMFIVLIGPHRGSSRSIGGAVHMSAKT